jgi:UDP-N-acetylmuramate--alanine ligase
MFRGRVRHIHFVGLGGIGMSGIAEVLLTLGYTVSGSDLKATDITRRLASLGAITYEGHRAENVAGADVVVYSSAVAAQNPEVARARLHGVPVIPRAEMLAELMRLKYGIAIAGSHGKTTTTSLVSTVLSAAGLDPTVVIGGKLNAINSNARAGTGELLVAEADESDGSFLKLTPTVAVITNIDPEHLDHYGTHARLLDALVEFADRVPFYGLAVLCLDHPHVQSILPRIDRRHVTYGTNPQADYVASDLTYEGLSTSFAVRRRGESLGRFEVRVPGLHNVLNCLATIAVAEELDVPTDTTREALRSFAGVQRRFTIVGEVTLAAAKGGFRRRVVAAFQPHRFTRTRDLFEEFTRAFNLADVLVVTEVYAAGEKPIEGATGERLAEAIAAHGHRGVHFEADKARVVDRLEALVQPGDVVIALGAGDINQSVRALHQRLVAKTSPAD